MSNWHHAPVHHLSHGDTFFVTGGTYLKQQFYASPVARDELQAILFAHATAQTCWLQAWVLLTNHYHLVVRAAGERMRRMLADFTAKQRVR